jgi:hypothetical protein
MLTQKQIISVVKKQLTFFHDPKDSHDINEDTVIGDILTSNEHNVQRLFQGNILWTLHNAGQGKKKFPSGWLNSTVADLASKLVMLVFMVLVGLTASAQLRLNVSGGSSTLKKDIINVGVTYLQELDSLYGNRDYMGYGKKSWYLVTPYVQMQAGTEDGFSSIVVGMKGLGARFRTTTVDGIETPDASKTMHVFPTGLGIETSTRFDFLNTLVEAGYEPFYQGYGNNSPDWLRHTSFGVYLQGGYKFKLDTSTKAGDQYTPAVGGEVDQSGEGLNSAIFRAKANFAIDTKDFIHIDNYRMGLIGKSTVWYNFLQKEYYYRVDGIARLYMSDKIFFDFAYQKGSGAPNFNQGDQFTAGLTITY